VRAALFLLFVGCTETNPNGADAGADALQAPYTPIVELGRHDVTITDSRRVIPGAGFPAETPAQNSNNNLDVVRHAGRVWLAWRSAPDHFASPQARIHVVSSTDERTWT
jgi:hypothetical protein